MGLQRHLAMKLRATISIEFEAEDALEARERMRDIERLAAPIIAQYESADCLFQERRPRTRPRAPAPEKIYKRQSGTA